MLEQDDLQLRRIKRTEYDRMVAAGLFEDERVELLDGFIVKMSPNDPPHAYPIELLNEFLVPRLLGRARVRPQLSVALLDTSQPEPDLAIVEIADHSRAHPRRPLAIIEVSHSSLRKDTGIKAQLYAKARIADYWVIETTSQEVIVYRKPVRGTYRHVRRYGRGEKVRFLAFRDVAVPVSLIFPGAH